MLYTHLLVVCRGLENERSKNRQQQNISFNAATAERVDADGDGIAKQRNRESHGFVGFHGETTYFRHHAAVGRKHAHSGRDQSAKAGIDRPGMTFYAYRRFLF